MDPSSFETAERLLNAGVDQLSPVRRDLVRAVYLEKVRGPKGLFRHKYGISSKQFDFEHERALAELKWYLCQRGIDIFFDVF